MIFFFFNDTATTEIYTLSLHDALPISADAYARSGADCAHRGWRIGAKHGIRSEEHTSELQSRLHLVCRLLLEKKKRRAEPMSTERRKYRTEDSSLTNLELWRLVYRSGV